MRRSGACLAVIVAGVAACAAAPAWPDRLDMTVTPELGSFAPGPAADLMVCVVDEGQARCHHRDGVLASTILTAGAATCPGAEAPLRPLCPGRGACALTGVRAPAGPFGLLVVSVRPPAFGVPRHAVAQAAILSHEPAALPAQTRARLGAALGAVARCVAPGDPRRLDPARRSESPGGRSESPEPPVVARAACTARACDLGRISLRLAPPGRLSMADH